MLASGLLQLTRRQLMGSSIPLFMTNPLTGGQRRARHEYTVYMVADNDSKPVMGTKTAPDFMHFSSTLTQLTLVQSQASGAGYSLSEESPPQAVPLRTGYSYGGRGAELSDLICTGAPDWKLYTFDDRTGIVFEVLATSREAEQTQAAESSIWESWHGRHLQGVPPSDVSLVPRWICSDGAGNSPGGFKCEWSTMKDGKIIIGSHGYEVWRMPPFLPGMGLRNVQYVKELCPRTGTLRHVDWSAFYNSLSCAAGVKANSGGYLTHEAAAWSAVHKRWFFMPRRCSKDQPWDPDQDGNRGCNLLLSTEDMPDGGPAQDISIVQIQGPTHPSRGYSAMRFLPDTNDTHIVATKTVEQNDGSNNRSYITVLTIDGQVLMPETLISDSQKLEGLEIAGW